MPDPIILAPAGTAAAVTAAVRCGADAVYLGAKNFNARRNAENFDELSLPATVRFCHERGAGVIVTVNTLVRDGELSALEETVDEVASAGVDGVIVQDMAVMRLFMERYPDLPRHASTQTVVHDLYGARYLEELGYQAIVLARELTLREIEYIASRVSVKTEAFVHGAHCMSLSGACYLSAMLGGRSGNRGLCAQPCRLDWRCGGEDYALSLKDMSLLDHVRELADAGVSMLKIEGRMKRPEYVAAAVTACRQAIAGEAYDADVLRSVFSRSGFTDGYLTGKRDKSMFGTRTKEDVTGAEKVLKKLSALYEKETPRVGVSMALTMTGEAARLAVSDGENTVAVSGEAPQKALNRPTDAESARKSLTKTGGTPFYITRFDADIQPGLMLPAAGLNALRREALEKLLALRGEPKPWPRRSAPEKKTAPARDRDREPALWARFYDPAQIPGDEAYEKLLLPVERLDAALIAWYGGRLVGELPAALFPEDEEAFARRLRRLRDAGLREVWGNNVYAIPLARELGLTLRGGAGLNVLNTPALEEYEAAGLQSVTASFELDMRSVKALGGSAPVGILAYGCLPLMRFRNCPVRADVGCAGCGGRGELTDRRGVRFAVECGEKKYSTLLNSVPLHIAERDLRGLDYALLWFTRESRAECRRVTEEYLAREKSAAPRTGGLYYRELL